MMSLKEVISESKFIEYEPKCRVRRYWESDDTPVIPSGAPIHTSLSDCTDSSTRTSTARITVRKGRLSLVDQTDGKES